MCFLADNLPGGAARLPAGKTGSIAAEPATLE
jgi:hypothetical protein